jgi:hypothetical protein
VNAPPAAPPSPIVAPGMGASLPDARVERLVLQWFEALAHDGLRDLARFVAFASNGGGSLGGNPTSQRKWAHRAARAWGDSLLSLHLAVGKRANYEVRLDVSRPMPAARKPAQSPPSPRGPDAPAPQWL